MKDDYELIIGVGIWDISPDWGVINMDDWPNV